MNFWKILFRGKVAFAKVFIDLQKINTSLNIIFSSFWHNSGTFFSLFLFKLITVKHKLWLTQSLQLSCLCRKKSLIMISHKNFGELFNFKSSTWNIKFNIWKSKTQTWHFPHLDSQILFVKTSKWQIFEMGPNIIGTCSVLLLYQILFDTILNTIEYFLIPFEVHYYLSTILVQNWFCIRYYSILFWILFNKIVLFW